jgi:hypothetical protein
MRQNLDVKLIPRLQRQKQSSRRRRRRRNTLFTSILDLNLGKEPVKYYTWSIANYSAET